MPKVEIESKYPLGKIKVDGVEVKDVTSIDVHIDAESLPTVTISFFSLESTIEIEEAAVNLRRENLIGMEKEGE